MPYGLIFRFAPWVLLAVTIGLYLDKRDELATTIEKANTDKVKSVLLAEKQVSKRLNEAHTQELEEREIRYRAAQKAIETATEAAQAAQNAAAEKDVAIRELQLEASIDDIPDSGECLNVYVPGGMLHTRDCEGTSPGGGSENGICVNTGRTDQTNPSFGSITFGELAEITNKNIATIDALNAQLIGIRKLNEEDNGN